MYRVIKAWFRERWHVHRIEHGERVWIATFGPRRAAEAFAGMVAECLGGAMTNRPSPNNIKSLLEYAPETGLFRWKNPSARQTAAWFKGNKGCRAYRRLYIHGQHFLAHVIAYVIMNGRWPRYEISHRDRDHANNKWHNLRHRVAKKRNWNRRINRNNSTGQRGVTLFRTEDRLRFRARLQVRQKHISLGLFDDPKAAAIAWRSAAITLYEGHYE
jgi:hypothetical protein